MNRLKKTITTTKSFAINTIYVLVGLVFYAADRAREVAQIAVEIGEVFFLAVRGVRRDQMTYWQKTIHIHYLGLGTYLRVPVKNIKLEQLQNAHRYIQARRASQHGESGRPVEAIKP